MADSPSIKNNFLGVESGSEIANAYNGVSIEYSSENLQIISQHVNELINSGYQPNDDDKLMITAIHESAKRYAPETASITEAILEKVNNPDLSVEPSVQENQIADLINGLPESPSIPDYQELSEKISALAEEGYAASPQDQAALEALDQQFEAELQEIDQQIDGMDAEIEEIDAKIAAQNTPEIEGIVENRSFTAETDQGATILITDFGPGVDRLDPALQAINLKEFSPIQADMLVMAMNERITNGDEFSAADIKAIDIIVESIDFCKGEDLQYWGTEGLEAWRSTFMNLRNVMEHGVYDPSVETQTPDQTPEPAPDQETPTQETPAQATPAAQGETGLLARSPEIDSPSDFLRDLDPAEVKEFQDKLKEAGFDCGASDGMLGQKTMAAWDACVEANGLDPNMTFDEALAEMGNTAPTAEVDQQSRMDQISAFAVEVAGELPVVQQVQGALEVGRQIAPDVQAFLGEAWEKAGQEMQAQQELAAQQQQDVSSVTNMNIPTSI